MFFFGGAVQLLLTMIWWMADLGGRYGGFYPAISWSISSIDAHAFLMIYGLFPYFMFGFLMTTYPRWMNGGEVERHHYVTAFLLFVVATILFYTGLVIGKVLLKIALVIFMAGWGMGLYALLRVYFQATHPDKRHATITSVVLTLGWLLVAGFTTGKVQFLDIARVGGIWLFLLPLFFVVSHRMIPFFSGNVIKNYTIVRPSWALVLIPVGAMLHALFELTGHQSWTWIVDLPMAIGAIYLTRAWQLRASLANPILGMLHIGFAWLGIALMLYTGQSLMLFVSGQLILAKAPLHALTVGYFSSMLFAMITRVTLGHSGELMKADRLTWGIFIVFQLVAVLRIFSELPGLSFSLHSQLYLCAGILWLICFGLWFQKYAPIYWKPRPDVRLS